MLSYAFQPTVSTATHAVHCLLCSLPTEATSTAFTSSRLRHIHAYSTYTAKVALCGNQAYTQAAASSHTRNFNEHDCCCCAWCCPAASQVLECACRQKLASVKLAMGTRFHSYKRNKLVRAKIKSHKQRMHYEAVIQVAEIKDADLLYLNFNNEAMGKACHKYPPDADAAAGCIQTVFACSLDCAVCEDQSECNELNALQNRHGVLTFKMWMAVTVQTTSVTCPAAIAVIMAKAALPCHLIHTSCSNALAAVNVVLCQA